MKTVLFLDTETTGLPEWKKPSGDECQPHLTQLAAILANEETQEVIASIDLVIKPEGWTIPEEVSKVHGITTEYASQVGISESLAVELLIQMWNGCKRVAHNRTFDQRIIRIALKRYASEEIQQAWADKENFDCTMLLAKPVMKMEPKGRYGYKQPKLEEAYKHFTGKDLEGAHSAMPDTKACMEVYWALKGSEQQAA